MSYRLNRNRNGGGVIIYITEDIPSKVLRKHLFPNDMEGIFVEINFRESRWLLCSTYHFPSQSVQHYFDNIDKALDVYCQYEKVVVLVEGDFNAQIGEKCFDDFLFQHELRSVNDNPLATKTQISLDVLNRHAPIKKKVIRTNHAPYVTKALRKAIMERSS